MTDRQDLIKRLRESGVTPSSVRILDGSESPGSIDPRLWCIKEMPADVWWVGGVDRGEFVEYDRYEGSALLTNALKHLTLVEATVVPTSDADAAARLIRTQDFVSTAGAQHIPAGIGLDRFGFDTGNVLFAFRTPFEKRSSPPSDLQLPYHSYVTTAELPWQVKHGPVAPWFEQPGGGFMVVLDRSIRWYFDAGLLDEVQP